MSAGELLLTLVVALFVLGPKKLPMVATHLGQLVRRFNQVKQQALDFWQQQLNDQQLQENIKKAEMADKDYLNDASSVFDDVDPVIKPLDEREPFIKSS